MAETTRPARRAVFISDTMNIESLMSSPQLLSPHFVGALLQSDPAAAAQVLWRAACEDNHYAQLLLGQMLLDGDRVERNPREALRWFRRAADAGVAMGMNMVGRCLENGWGAPTDFEQAASWYLRAAEQELDWALYNYAHMLANGRGVARDRAQALQWFKRAAALGHARSMNFIGQYYEFGWEVEADPAAAVDWYRRSAEGGDFRGQCSYASVLTDAGRIDEAAHWLGLAIQTATPAYLEQLAVTLEASPHARLRRIAAEIRAERPQRS